MPTPPEGSRRRLLARLGGAIVAAVLASTAPVHAAESVLVFAAASLKTALDQAIASYTRATGQTVRASYAASSTLARQLEQAAPADLFISADRDWMDHVEQRGLIAAGTRGDLLGNAIVLITKGDSGIGEVALVPGVDIAGLLNGGRLAMADAASVPAGKYGKAALESLSAWAALAPHLARAENVRAALAYVSRGEAPLGIVYATDAVADPNVRVIGTFPPETHPPIIYPAALTARHKPAAAEFLTFLRTSAAARAAFMQQGFTMRDMPGS